MGKQTERNSRSARLCGRALCLALALVIAAALLPWGGMRARAEGNDNYVFDSETGTLTISGVSIVTENEVYQAINRDRRNLKKVVIQAGVTGIGNKAFYECNNLTDITLPNGLTTIGEKAFYYCMESSINLPDSVTSIGYRAFDYNNNLTSLKLPANLKMIENETFFNCYNLTSVILNEGLETIGNQAFYANSITSLDIPSSVSSIYWNSFLQCNSLNTLKFNGSGITISGGKLCVNQNNITVIKIPCKYTINGTDVNEDNVSIYIEPTWIKKVDFYHSLEHISETAPSCEQEGNSEYWHCTGCGKYFSDEACTQETTEAAEKRDALGHDLTAHAAKASTCVDEGNIAYWTCGRDGCGKWFSEAGGKNEITDHNSVITHDPDAHDLTAVPAKAATCKDTGNIAYWKCGREGCGKLFGDAEGKNEITEAQTVVAVDEDAHQWNSGVITKEATRHETGVMTYTCTLDSSHTKTEELPKVTTENGYAFVTSDHKYSLRSGKTVLMTVKRSSGDDKTYEKFEELLIDGNVVPTGSYDKASGSVKVTLKTSYLDKLSKGTHSVRFNFTDGYAESALKITSSGSGSTPGTGDDTKANDLVSGMILFILSLSFVAYSVYADKLTRAKLLAAFSGASGAETQQPGDGSDDIISDEHSDDGFDDIIE